MDILKRCRKYCQEEINSVSGGEIQNKFDSTARPLPPRINKTTERQTICY